MYTVYLITNTANQMKYVGITEHDIHVRLYFHLTSTSKNPNHGPKFQKDLEEYGKDVYIIEPLAINLTEEWARKLERYYIEFYDTVRNGLNTRYGSDVGFMFHSEEIDQIYNEYISGESVQNIALNHNVTYNTIRALVIDKPFYRPTIRAAGDWYYQIW